MAEDAEGALDKVSAAIVDSLRPDGRKSYAAIAKEVGVSEATVRQRLQKLIEQGHMQIVAVTNPVGPGRFTSMLLVKTQGGVDAVAEALRDVPEVTFAVATAGSYDVLVEVTSRDGAHLLSVIDDSIRTIEAVTEVQTLIYLKLLKLSYQSGVWPTTG
ncbi:transcriptional regulator [Mycolicibacterium parafortuitum]|uniref:Transcriptional regulator n=1 Tax=Mycolicibacterium parafortuitum TaxID=39692 RepID=A0A7I7TX02_MYCPF|nr:Lrp/AsnC family transcriptional regulator [Mycolicibacterium parafortuitum]PQE01724.1 AsnC family transcriptional regulator [Mycobacterium sp. EPG1]BBY73648.1 transcriptional regulator [Mycolicibacterium parafortuitum]